MRMVFVIWCAPLVEVVKQDVFGQPVQRGCHVGLIKPQIQCNVIDADALKRFK